MSSRLSLAPDPILARPDGPATPLSLAGGDTRVKIRPKTGWQPVELGELWHYRELLWILARRDVRVRYKQTALGAAWAVIQPFATMVVFVIISRLGKLSTDGLDAPLVYYVKLLPWQLFATALANAGNSLVGNQNLITKVYFPRLVIPIASVVTALVDFAVAFGMLVLMMAWYRVAPGWPVLLLPAFVGLAFAAALAVGLWLSALNVEFRDVRYVIPFLVQFWLFATPILYTASSVTVRWKRVLLGVNPMSGVVEGFRWCLLGGPPPGPMLAVSAASIGLLLVGGVFYFRRMEKSFADLV